MPYNLRKIEGKYCVMNTETGENKGCSDTRAMGIKHLRAMYAAEGGASMGKKELDNLVIKSYFSFINDPDTTDETLDTEALAEGLAEEAETTQVPAPQPETPQIQTTTTVSNVGTTEYVIATNVEPLIETTSTFVPTITVTETPLPIIDTESFFNRVIQKVKSLLGYEDESDQTLMVWKEGDTYRWMTRYSNNFRDEDYPPEIISEKSHRQFVDDVEKGLAPYPELWLWHIPEWKLGQADWLAWDDSGYALAAGRFYPGRSAMAEWLSKQKGWAVSHGMPVTSIERDAGDPSVIIRHTTREISPLPLNAAANKRTGFVVLKENDNMAIPDEKKKALIEKWGLKPEVLAELEALNATDADKAVADGIERKEQPAPPAAENDTPTLPTPPAETQPAEQPITRQEIADAIAAVVVPAIEDVRGQVKSLSETVEALNKEIAGLKQADETKIAQKAADIPLASLSSMIMARVVGNPKTEVKESDPLESASPKQAPAQPKGRFGINYLDELLADNRK